MEGPIMVSSKLLGGIVATAAATALIVGFGMAPAYADGSGSQTVVIDPAHTNPGQTVTLEDGVVYTVKIDGVVTVDPSNKDEQGWNGAFKVIKNGVPIAPKPVAKTVTLNGKSLVSYRVGSKPAKTSSDSVSYAFKYGSSDDGTTTVTLSTGLNIVGRDAGGNYTITVTPESAG